MSNIITITTDFGLEDNFVGVMKGVILSVNPGVTVVDLSNNIKRHDIRQASISLKNSYKYFPPETVHLVVVDPGVGSSRRPIAVECHDHFFVGPDNGVFSFLYNETGNCKVHEITNRSCMLNEVSSTFHGRDIFAPAAAYLSIEKDVESVGGLVRDPVTIKTEEPTLTDTGILGKVVYTDTFGNLITNINSEMIENGDEIKIRDLTFTAVSESYSEVNKGEPLVVAGSSGYLEIAVNLGDASMYFKDDEMDVEIIKKKGSK